MLSQLPIGIIQNAPLTADFPNNLRQIVQGYRECIDHGAKLVIASAFALCGSNPEDLVDRKSFIRQTSAALNTLSLELGEVPLILGAYSELFDEDDATDDSEGVRLTALSPYLLENSTITELDDAGTIDLDGLTIYVDTNQDTTPADTEQPDLIIHLATGPWYAGAAIEEEENGRWEAQMSNAPVIMVHHVGSGEQNLYAGGSTVYSPQGTTLARLPFFTKANKVVNVMGCSRSRALPEEIEVLEQALEFGIRNMTHNCGYNGVCINLDQKHAPLLATLCVQALGRSHVIGITACGNTHAAKELGISYKEPDISQLLENAGKFIEEDVAALNNRLTNSIFFSIAEKLGMMYLSSLTRRDFMLGDFNLYGDSCGHLAPLANLYEMDIYLLSKKLSESYSNVFGPLKEPSTPEVERIIHELADRNISATELLNERVCPFKENDVRQIQRKIIASALKRSQFPQTLRVDRPAERTHLPISHRLND